ncbi:MAG: TIGR02996 domain-containing protein [Archangiaceae bacterium]|nr:TIGR02996 domain-containing protein [Archangiaceae bacterium]
MASGDELLSLVYQSPELDEPRLVYGDWLQQQGDGRAELLVLQLEAKPGRDELARAKALVRQFGRSWLGRLAPVIAKGTEQFSRGFPSAGAVTFSTQALCDELTGLPAWNTFTALAGGVPHFFVGTELRGLESLSVMGDEVVPLLARRPWPFRRLERLSVRWCSSFTLPALNELDVPALRHLELAPNQGERERLPGVLAKLEPVVGRLESLRVERLGDEPTLRALLAKTRLRRLELDSPSVVFHRVRNVWVLEVLRTPKRLPSLSALLPLVAAIVEPDARWGDRRAGVRADLQRLGLELVQL